MTGFPYILTLSDGSQVSTRSISANLAWSNVSHALETSGDSRYVTKVRSIWTIDAY